MWHAAASAEPPAATISSAIARQSSRRRLVTTTCAPNAPSSFATSAPMPRLPPVTTAILPDRSNRLGALMKDIPSG
ncbi:hypothetical protein X980_4482 [Burkholderia pseudomallei MSHR4000]|nr:hypothetical protein X980_4482 [Burkholderia pseudomallei MSHR4000]